MLATGTLEGKPLTMDEIVVNCYSLILGGDETSRLSMTGAVAAFLEHPHQWRALLKGEVEVSTAVEEVLRWTTPAIHFGRSALEDVPVGDRGQEIKAGDIVTLWNTSANMDEEVFADPGRFDLARTPNKHIAFGYGPHFCLGAYLGRARDRGHAHRAPRHRGHDRTERGAPPGLFEPAVRHDQPSGGPAPRLTSGTRPGRPPPTRASGASGAPAAKPRAGDGPVRGN